MSLYSPSSCASEAVPYYLLLVVTMRLCPHLALGATERFLSQVGVGGAATQGAVREAGARQPVHIQGESGSLDHQGTQVTEQGNPGQG